MYFTVHVSLQILLPHSSILINDDFIALEVMGLDTVLYQAYYIPLSLCLIIIIHNTNQKVYSLHDYLIWHHLS